MDEKKKTRRRGEKRTRVGPYLLDEEVASFKDGAELCLATHEPTGARALVLLGGARGEEPSEEWEVLLSASAAFRYLALHVLRTPWSRAPDRQTLESLLFTFASVLVGMRRMARVVPDIEEPRPRWRLGLSVAGAAAVCLLLLTLVWRVPVSLSPSGPEPLPSAPPAPLETLDPSIIGGLADTAPQEPLVLARPMPKQPYKGQKRPPCTRYTEVELIGACWMPHRLKAPCPDSLHEHQGECYAPSFSAKPPPQSVEP